MPVKSIVSMQQLQTAYYAGRDARRRGRGCVPPNGLSRDEKRAWRNGYNDSVCRFGADGPNRN